LTFCFCVDLEQVVSEIAIFSVVMMNADTMLFGKAFKCGLGLHSFLTRK